MKGVTQTPATYHGRRVGLLLDHQRSRAIVALVRRTPVTDRHELQRVCVCVV
jgi:hypothetical protein